MKFQGVYTAIITPFHKDGQLDEEGFCQLLDHQIKAKVEGIVVLGTTGEAPTLNAAEKKRLIQIAREKIPISMQLIAGTGNYSTEQTIRNTQEAEKMGVDGALIVTPYYNKPTQEGIFLHYQAISSACRLPIILYNIAGRTGMNMLTTTLKRLMDIPSIVGIKEASGNLAQMMDMIELRNQSRPEFKILSGDDNFTLPLMALGGDGIISVVSNLIPDLIHELFSLCLKRDFEGARNLHYKLLPLFRGAFIETNPIPIKTLMQFSDLPSGPCRLPLCSASPENEKHLRHLYETLKMSLFASV